MNDERQILAIGFEGFELQNPTPGELNLISSMLPGLMLLLQQIDDSDED
ncbi:hypothetical protein [Georgfuchsia toluolica]|nr:hypothetical protein [Georgfuchsia toluolica]